MRGRAALPGRNALLRGRRIPRHHYCCDEEAGVVSPRSIKGVGPHGL